VDEHEESDSTLPEESHRMTNNGRKKRKNLKELDIDVV
jgi:hypothetical protein